jgi:hypothetical protein
VEWFWHLQRRTDRRKTMKLIHLPAVRAAFVATTTAVLCGSLLVAGPANADEIEPHPSSSVSPGQAGAVDALLGAVDRSARIFDARRALARGASVLDVQDFADTWVALDAGAVTGISPRQAEVAELRGLLVRPAACKGRNAWDRTGLQYNLYFNSCKAGELSRAYGTGAASLGVVTAICGAIGFAPGAAGAAIIGSILGLGAAIVNNCNAKGRGIVVRAVPPVVWCNGQ